MTPDRRDAILMALAGVLAVGVQALGPLVRVADPEVMLWMPLLSPALLAVGLGVFEGRRRRRGLPARGVAAWLPAVLGMATFVAGAVAWGRWQHGAGPDGGLAASIVVAGVAVGAVLVATITMVVARAVGGRQ